MRYILHIATLFVLTSAVLCAEVTDNDQVLVVSMGDTTLEFPKYQGWLLGMSTARVDDYDVTSDSLLRPMVAQEFTKPHGGTRQLWPFLKLESVDHPRGWQHLLFPAPVWQRC